MCSLIITRHTSITYGQSKLLLTNLKVYFDVSHLEVGCFRMSDVEIPSCEEFITEINFPLVAKFNVTFIKSVSHPETEDNYDDQKH